MTTSDWLAVGILAFGSWLVLAIGAVVLWVLLRLSGWQGITKR